MRRIYRAVSRGSTLLPRGTLCLALVTLALVAASLGPAITVAHAAAPRQPAHASQKDSSSSLHSAPHPRTTIPGSLIWQYQIGGVPGSIAVVGGSVYTCSNNDYNDGTVYALNENTGSLRWTFTTPSAAFTCSVANNIVYVGTQQAYIVALNASTGALLWSYSPGGSIDYMGPVVNGTLYFGTSFGIFYALDATTGALRWEYQTSTYEIDLPEVVNGVVYFGASNNYVYALDANTGATLWRFETGGPNDI